MIARIPVQCTRHQPPYFFMKITLNVNGKAADVELDDPGMPLLYALRDGLGLRGPRFGCGLAQCGACTVLVNGQAMRSCVYPVSAVGNATVTTLEGLGTSAHPDPLQQAFIDDQAVQVWVLHQRHDHAGEGSAQSEPASNRPRDLAGPRGQSLPLRHAPANRAGGQARGAQRVTGYRDV